jgi:molybdopterin converting factor small subunit
MKEINTQQREEIQQLERTLELLSHDVICQCVESLVKSVEGQEKEEQARKESEEREEQMKRDKQALEVWRIELQEQDEVIILHPL